MSSMSRKEEEELMLEIRQAKQDKKKAKANLAKAEKTLVTLKGELYAATCPDHITINGQCIRLKFVSAISYQTYPSKDHAVYRPRESEDVTITLQDKNTLKVQLGKLVFERDDADESLKCSETVQTRERHRVDATTNVVDGKLVLVEVSHHWRGY